MCDRSVVSRIHKDIAYRMIELVPVERTLSLEEILASEDWGVSSLSDTVKLEWDSERVCRVGDLRLKYGLNSIMLLDGEGVQKMKLSFVKDAEPQFRYLSLLFEKWLSTEGKRHFKGEIAIPAPRRPLSKRNEILKQLRSKAGRDDLPEIRRRVEDLDHQIDTIVGALFNLGEDDMKIIDNYSEKIER